VERQKPGNDFDKVTKRHPTTRRKRNYQEGTIDSECLSCTLEKFISATFGHAVDAVFNLRLKADERVLAPLRHGVVKSSVPGWRPALSFRVFTRSTHRARIRRPLLFI